MLGRALPLSHNDVAERSETVTSSSRTEHGTTLPGVSRRKTLAKVLAAGSTGLLIRLGLAEGTSARKKRRRKKKQCRKFGETCTVGSKRTCCVGSTCGPVGGDDPQTLCCLEFNAPCQEDRDCCAPNACDPTLKTCSRVMISDRHAKANFGTIDPEDMLERVRALPITTWNYRTDDASVRHIGPMAQDFTAAFGVGSDDRTIHPMDGQGVALAAIQGLAAQVVALQGEQQHLLEQIAALEARCQVAERS